MKKTNTTKYLGSYSAGSGGSGGGKGAVESVNGKVGVVNITGENINTTVDTSSLTVAEDIKNLKSTKFDAINLVGGNNISITPLSPVGGIDDYTTLLLHFDNSLNDSSSKNVQYTTSGTPLYREIHTNFGTAVNISGGNVKYTSPDAFNFETKDWTLDFWSYLTSLEDTWGELYFTKDGTTSTKVKIENGVMSFFLTSDPVPTFTYTISSANAFNHFAFQRSGDYVYWYLNGKLMGNYQYVSSMPLADSLNIYDGSTNDNKVFFDELRVSNGKAEFDIDGFTPNEYPYTTSDGESGIHVINFTGSTLPDNVYTQDNLISGKNVTFTEVPPEGGIDEYTIAVWNFDGNTNWVDDRGVEYPSDFTYQQVNLNSTHSKFGNGSASCPNYAGAWIDPATLQANYGMKRANRNESFTIDWWSLWTSEINSSGKLTSKMGFIGTNYGFEIEEDVRYIANAENTINIRTAGVQQSATFDATAFGVEYGKWVHKALEYDCSGDLAVARLYINGHIAATIEGIEKSATEMGTFQFGCGYNEYLDEVRISKIARYKGIDFSDSLPTKAYTLATGPSKTAVNAIIPEGIYTKTNLLGGKDIEIVPEPVEGGIDEYTLACWHFDGKFEDEVNGLALQTNTALLETDYVKFGTGSCKTVGKFTEEFSSANDFSFDFWAFVGSPGGSSYASATATIFSSYFGQGVYNFVATAGEKLKTQLEGEAYPLPETEFTTNRGQWAHYYCHYDSQKRVFDLFANGKMVSSRAITRDFSRATIEISSSGVVRFDEARISKCIRWTEDFTPPTEAYSKAEPTGNMVVNFVGDIQTVKNDLDELGDQVSEIESKIPGTTSATNLLVNKSELESITNTKVTGEGVTSIKVLTQADYTALETKDQSTCYIIVG